MANDLRTLLEEAASEINRYRRPDVSEAQERIHELLVAAQLGGCEHDTLSYIGEEDGEFLIRTEWSARGCEQESRFEIPSTIIDADDPIKAATEWGHAKRIREAEEKVQDRRRDLEWAEGELAKRKAAAAAAGVLASDGKVI